MGTAINKLLELAPDRAPDTRKARLPRLGLELTLREAPYNKIGELRGKEDADLLYLLASIEEPNVKDRAWWEEHMDCPTPVDALKKLLKKGEVEQLCQLADKLNGYGAGSVLAVKEKPEVLQSQAISAVLEDLEKN